MNFYGAPHNSSGKYRDLMNELSDCGNPLSLKNIDNTKFAKPLTGLEESKSVSTFNPIKIPSPNVRTSLTKSFYKHLTPI